MSDVGHQKILLKVLKIVQNMSDAATTFYDRLLSLTNNYSPVIVTKEQKRAVTMLILAVYPHNRLRSDRYDIPKVVLLAR